MASYLNCAYVSPFDFCHFLGQNQFSHLQEVEGEVELVDHGGVDGDTEEDEYDGGPLVRPPPLRHCLLQLLHRFNEPLATPPGAGLSL